MILVMLAITFSLGLTYGFMQTQVTSLQLSQNDVRRDLALEAARTGVSAGLLRMQDPAWIGLSDTYSRITQQDGTNLVSCAVSFSALASGQVATVPDAELPMHVCITSIGTWSSPRNSSIVVTRTIRAVVRLMPRLPGRAVRAGDVATATDLAVNPANYQATLPYTLTATSAWMSLNFEPGTRIEGPIWLQKRLALFNSENWSTSIRGTMLTEIGNQYGAAIPANFVHPHPLNGPITFGRTPSGSIQTDLSRLKTSWSTTTNTPSVATVNANQWLTYQLYQHGPIYQATQLSNSLNYTSLQPSPSNPLGVFVRSGSLDVYDRVNIQGTLVVTGTVNFWGVGTTITSYNWMGASGPVVAGADQWPRLPAVVAQNMSFSNATQTVIEGAVMIDNQLSGDGADYTNPSANQVNLSGTATASRGQQPYSTVKLVGSPDLSSISGNQVYAVWLANGTSGRWYPIQSLDNTAKTLTVVGEAIVATAVPYKIRLNRSQFANLYGPVTAGRVGVDNESEWTIQSPIWTNTYFNWTSTNNALQSQGKPRISFCDWIANPANLNNLGWYLPYNTAIYGLQLEPTFSIQPTPTVKYLANLPLFTPYTSIASDSAASGYRWKIVDWREDI